MQVKGGICLKIQRFTGGMLEGNGYVIYQENGKECWIIDPGYGAKRFIAFVKENNFDLNGILLTHHHYDHVGAVEKIKNELDCKVYLHRNDCDIYGKPVDVYLEDGDIIELGDEKIRVIHTPGHTKGSVCFMAEKSKVCFTGDTVFNVDLGRTDLEDGSESEMLDSIRNKVDGWSNDIMIYPGHGDGCTMKKVRKINHEFIEMTKGFRKRGKEA